MNTLKIAKNCFYDVYVHICKCASGTNARCVGMILSGNQLQKHQNDKMPKRQNKYLAYMNYAILKKYPCVCSAIQYIHVSTFI